MPNVPFLLNADFLLTSSREDIHVDEPWNKWLINCVSGVFVEAFDTFLEKKEFSELLYKFIPLKSPDTFIKPAIESILNTLHDMDIILTEPDWQRVRPSEGYLISNKLRSLLFETTLPKSIYTNRVVLESIELYKIKLKKLGVSDYPDEFIQECFSDVDWIKQHDLNWLLRCYQYFESTKIDVSHCPIIPVDTDNGVLWHTKTETGIYYPINGELKPFIKEIPYFILLNLLFLNSDLYEIIQKKKDICHWIEDIFEIQALKKEDILDITLDWVINHFETMSEEEIIIASLYFSKELGSQLLNRNIPLILSNGKKILSSCLKSESGIQALVTPMAFDPETGWQNVFTTEQDREHLMPLSDSYVTYAKKIDKNKQINQFFEIIGVTPYPPPQKQEFQLKNGDSLPPNYYEAKCWNSTDLKFSRYMNTTNWKTLELLNRFQLLIESEKDTFTRSLLVWLKNQSLDKYKYDWREMKIKFFYGSSYNKTFPSELNDQLTRNEWLPTTKGYLRPKDVFIRSPGITEIFEDSVPYYDGPRDDNLLRILKLLGVRTEVSSRDLVDYLSSLSGRNDVAKDVIEKIYRRLSSIRPLDPDLQNRFASENLIFIPLNNTNGKWATKDQVIWLDRSQVLEDDYYYLSKYYPKELEHFIVDTLGIKKDVDSECFANRLLRLQEEPIDKSRDYSKLLAVIYRELRKVSIQDIDKRPSWWNDFQRKVKLWTTNSNFEPTDLVYIPDDGELKEIFEGPEIHFVWYPPSSSDSHSNWNILFKSLAIKNISEVVERSIGQTSLPENRSKPHYLTLSAKTLILTSLFEEHPELYKRLGDNQMVELLLKTDESIIPVLEIEYKLKTHMIQKQQSAYWDIKTNTLLLLDQTNKHNNLDIARSIARELIILGSIENKISGKITDFIELVVGSDKEYCRKKIYEKNWNIPKEVKDYWLEDKDSEVGEPEGKIESILSDESEIINQTSVISPSIIQIFSQDNDEELIQTFNKPTMERNVPPLGGEKGKEIIELPTKRPPNPEKRNERVTNIARKAPERTKVIRERSISINRDEIKSESEPYLRDQYTNDDGIMICQICQDELPFKIENGEYFFEKVEFLTELERIHTQNFLALCPNHSAMIQHANQYRNKMKNLFLQMEGCKMEIWLAGKTHEIYFTETHICDLRAIIDSERKS